MKSAKRQKERTEDKSQSAIEYITTYGWALIIIAIIITILSTFIAAPAQVVSNSCNFVNGAYCNDMVIATNTITHSTTLALFLTNTQKYPLKNPQLYAQVNGVNTTPFSCSPNFVLSGGSILCTVTLPVTSNLGLFLAGNLYLNATYCGLSTGSYSSTHNCTQGVQQIYVGNFQGHTQPLVSTKSSITLTAVNYTQAANGNPDQLTAVVRLLGYPLKGATVNFTADNIIYPISIPLTTTNYVGTALSSITGTIPGSVTVNAAYAGLSNSILITFTSPTYITFLPNPFAYCSNSGTVADVDGVPYTCSQLASKQFAYSRGTTHSYSFINPVSIPTNTQEVFQSIEIDGIIFPTTTGTITVTGNETIPFSYYVQYLLTEVASPPGAQSSLMPGTSWFTALNPITISEQPSVSPIVYFFNGWTNPGGSGYEGMQPTDTFTSNSPVIEVANYYSTATTSTTVTTSSTVGTITSTTSTSTSTSTTSIGVVYAYIYGVAGNDGLVTSVYYAPVYTDGSLGAWGPGTSYPLAVASHSCSTYSYFLYCAGGTTGGSGYTSAANYAPVSSSGVGTWGAASQYPAATESESCSTYGGYLYCVGGVINTGLTSSVYYATINGDGSLGAWQATAPYPTIISQSSCATYNGYIYCVGGSNGAQTTSAYYAPVSGSGVGTWQSTTPYPMAIIGHSCSTYNGYIYCVGGSSSGTQTADVYYASVSGSGIGAWQATTAYPTSVNQHACASANGFIYCVGGLSGSSDTSLVYYAPISGSGVGTWQSTSSYPLNIYQSSVAIALAASLPVTTTSSSTTTTTVGTITSTSSTTTTVGTITSTSSTTTTVGTITSTSSTTTTTSTSSTSTSTSSTTSASTTSSTTTVGTVTSTSTTSTSTSTSTSTISGGSTTSSTTTSSTSTISSSLTASISANPTSISLGQSTQVTVTWLGGTTPDTVSLYSSRTSTCSSGSTFVTSTVVFGSFWTWTESPSSSIYYCAVVTDSSAPTPQSALTNAVQVVVTGSTTTSTTTSSTTSILTYLVTIQENPAAVDGNYIACFAYTPSGGSQQPQTCTSFNPATSSASVAVPAGSEVTALCTSDVNPPSSYNWGSWSGAYASATPCPTGNLFAVTAPETVVGNYNPIGTTTSTTTSSTTTILTYLVTIQENPAAVDGNYIACFAYTPSGGSQQPQTCTSFNPATSSASVAVPAGSEVTYLCTADVNPPSSYNWGSWSGAYASATPCLAGNIFAVTAPETVIGNYNPIATTTSTSSTTSTSTSSTTSIILLPLSAGPITASPNPILEGSSTTVTVNWNNGVPAYTVILYSTPASSCSVGQMSQQTPVGYESNLYGSSWPFAGITPSSSTRYCANIQDSTGASVWTGTVLVTVNPVTSTSTSSTTSASTTSSTTTVGTVTSTSTTSTSTSSTSTSTSASSTSTSILQYMVSISETPAAAASTWGACFIVTGYGQVCSGPGFGTSASGTYPGGSTLYSICTELWTPPTPYIFSQWTGSYTSLNQCSVTLSIPINSNLNIVANYVTTTTSTTSTTTSTSTSTIMQYLLAIDENPGGAASNWNACLGYVPPNSGTEYMCTGADNNGAASNSTFVPFGTTVTYICATDVLPPSSYSWVGWSGAITQPDQCTSGSFLTVTSSETVVAGYITGTTTSTTTSTTSTVSGGGGTTTIYQCDPGPSCTACASYCEIHWGGEACCSCVDTGCECIPYSTCS